MQAKALWWVVLAMVTCLGSFGSFWLQEDIGEWLTSRLTSSSDCNRSPYLFSRGLFQRVALRDPSEADADLVTCLPGYTNNKPMGGFKSEHRAGYITVDERTGRSLYYYFTAAVEGPCEDAPFVLWMNGGPGCSSLDGFIYEMGPFKFDLLKANRARLVDNPYAWNRKAHMLYLESPAGVGFSYSKDTHDYNTNDTRTAHDANTFLRKWFERHPQYLQNDLYISGESYAGIYVPNLALSVMEGNKAGEEPQLNLKGYLVGNGCTDEVFDGNAHPLFAMGKSLIPYVEWRQLDKECGGSYWNRTFGSKCDTLWNTLMSQLGALNVYDVLETCYHDLSPDSSSSSSSSPSMHTEPIATRHSGRSSGGMGTSTDDKHLLKSRGSAVLDNINAQSPTHDMKLQAAMKAWPVVGHPVQAGSVHNWAHLQQLGLSPPCTNTRVASVWLNSAEVREAIHAAPITDVGSWALCSDKILYTHDAGSMLPIHHQLIEQYGLRALIYSGDHDMAVPHTGSEAWTHGFGAQVVAPWQPWYVEDNQVAGFVVEYEGLTYATIKGAGHMVPQNKPLEALAMFERFLFDQTLNPTLAATQTTAAA